MRWIPALLLIALMALQYKLWFSDRGLFEWRALQERQALQKVHNKKLKAQNQALSAEITELKAGDQALEEQARDELGMIREGEVYYQFID